MTRSWGLIGDMQEFEVIIDNLMNLELLFWAAANGGPAEYLDMAISHVDKTFEWWVRPDSSTFHLVVFNPNNSAVISRSATPQGLSVNSTWYVHVLLGCCFCRRLNF
jgi:unsaturated chondroitin disaccharide hydrolase